MAGANLLQHFNISPAVENGIFTMGAAAVTGILGLLSGDHSGKQKGRAEFINAVERAAELVITRLETQVIRQETQMARLETMHEECERTKAQLAAQVEELMTGPVAAYHLNKDRLDG